MFSPYSRSYSVHFSFPTFLAFLTIFQVLPCVFLFSHDFQFSLHTPGPFLFSTFLSISNHIPRPTVYISSFPCFECFSPYSRSYSVHFSFPTFLVFLTIFQLLLCVFLFSHDFQFSRHTPGPTVYISHFLRFWVLLTIFQAEHCLGVSFPVFQFSRHNPRTPVCISHFPRFLIFLVRFLVKQYFCLLCHVFQFSCHIPGPTVYISYFPCFECFLPYSR